MKFKVEYVERQRGLDVWTRCKVGDNDHGSNIIVILFGFTRDTTTIRHFQGEDGR